MYAILKLLPSGREAKMDCIRQDLGTFRGRQIPHVLTRNRRRSSSSVDGNKQDETFAIFFPTSVARNDGIL